MKVHDERRKVKQSQSQSESGGLQQSDNVRAFIINQHR